MLKFVFDTYVKKYRMENKNETGYALSYKRGVNWCKSADSGIYHEAGKRRLWRNAGNRPQLLWRLPQIWKDCKESASGKAVYGIKGHWVWYKGWRSCDCGTAGLYKWCFYGNPWNDTGAVRKDCAWKRGHFRACTSLRAGIFCIYQYAIW